MLLAALSSFPGLFGKSPQSTQLRIWEEVRFSFGKIHWHLRLELHQHGGLLQEPGWGCSSWSGQGCPLSPGTRHGFDWTAFHRHWLTPASFRARNIADPPELSPRANGTPKYSAIAVSASLTWFWPPWYLWLTLMHNILLANHTTFLNVYIFWSWRVQGGFVAKIWKSPAGPLEGGIYLNRRPERSRFETLTIPSSEIGSGAPQSFSQTGSPIPRLIMCCKRAFVYYIGEKMFNLQQTWSWHCAWQSTLEWALKYKLGVFWSQIRFRPYICTWMCFYQRKS